MDPKMDSQPLLSLSITVTDPLLTYESESRNASSYVTYLIKHAAFSVRHRYSSFDTLRARLVQAFPGVYVPPISSKKITKNTEEKFVEERRRGLEYFCQKMLERPHLFESKLFQTFLKESAVSKTVGNLELESLLPVYGRFSSEVSPSEAMIKNEKEYVMLKKLQLKLDVLRNDLMSASEYQKSLINQDSKILGETITKYERNFIGYHSGQDPKAMLLVNNPSHDLQILDYLQFSELHNKIDEQIQVLSYDLRESRAFLEAIQGRKTLQNRLAKQEHVRRKHKEEVEKLEGGKTTLKSLFSGGSKEDKIKGNEDKIKELEREIQILGQIIGLSDQGIHAQISSYKQMKAKKYLDQIGSGVKKEMTLWGKYAKIMIKPLKALTA